MQAATYIWAKVIGILEQRLSAVAVRAMLDDAELIELNDNALILYSPTDFRQELIRRSCKAHIEDILREEFGLSVSLEVLSDAQLQKHRQKERGASPWAYNPHFNFSSFIAGDVNQVPLKAAIQVAEDPDSIYNPLYLYGPPGVGKTHLLYSIANRISQLRPEAKIICVRGDQFTNELIQSILNRTTAQFKEKYRSADVLLMDDIQFIAGKETTQEEFFHTFNSLYDLRKQIVLTSDRNPSDMPALADRLRCRFGAGVMVKLEPPDKQARLQIIRAKANILGLRLDEDAVALLADRLCDNVRQIEGGLRQIRAYQELSGMPLTLENIAKTVAGIQPGAPRAHITADLVLRYVCRYYGVEEAQLKGRSRNRNISEPRQVAMYLIRQLTGQGLDNIGQLFGRDHSTVKYALSAIQDAVSLGRGDLEAKLQDIVRNIEAQTDC